MESLFEQTDMIRQKGRRWRKIRNSIFLVLVFSFFCWVGIQYYYPYSKGIKTGKLHYVVYKGQVFKTYEGKLIQTDIATLQEGNLELNEFDFSIAKKRIAEQLMQSGGKTVDLHYTEYFKALPWRGYSRYVVDEIVNISDNKEIEEADIVAERAHVKIQH